MSFVHLHVHTTSSRLDGMVTVEPYVDLCVKEGMPAATILDHGSMSSAIQFYVECKAKGINPLIGQEIYLVDDHRDPTCARYHEGLIAMDWQGYQSLVNLSSLGFTDGLQRATFPTIDDEQIAGSAAGLICLSGCISSRLSRTVMGGLRGRDALLTAVSDAEAMARDPGLLAEQRKLARSHATQAVAAHGLKKNRLLVAAQDLHHYLDTVTDLIATGGLASWVHDQRLKAQATWEQAWADAQAIVERRQRLFGDRYYLETQIVPLEDQIIYNDYVRQLSKLTGIPCVVTADAHYLNKEDADLHRQMLRIRTEKAKKPESEAKTVVKISFPKEQEAGITATAGDESLLRDLYDELAREEMACLGKIPKTTTKAYAERAAKWIKNAQLWHLQNLGGTNEDDGDSDPEAIAIDDIDPGRPFSEWLPDFWVRTPAEMLEAGAHPEEMANTVALADRCHLELPVNDDTHRVVHMPDFPLPVSEPAADGEDSPVVYDSPEDYLAGLCLAGLRAHLDRFPHLAASEYHRQLDYELKVICESGFANYFLIVWDYINHVRSLGGLCGPGRGSASGCLVTFLLGITKIIDPLQYSDLMFERFLTPGRPDLPDIDTDIDMESAGKLLAYCQERYGADRVCKIATFTVIGVRQALKDFGRVFGIDYVDVQRASGVLADWQPDDAEVVDDNKALFDLATITERIPELKELRDKSPEHQRWFAYSSGLVGAKRNVSQHASGVAISSKPLIELGVPLLVSRNTAKELITTSQFDMNDMATLGIPKFDQLKLSFLNIIAETERLIGDDFSIEEIPLDDRETFAALSRGDNLGIFQVAQSKVRSVLKKVKPKRLSDIAAVVTVIRPGLMARDEDTGATMEELFLSRAEGSRPVIYKHPFLEPILKSTQGVMLYQEQTLRILWACGFGPLEADKLRKIMSKKKMSQVKEFEPRFIQGAQERQGLTEDQALALWATIAEFASYSFCSAHAYSYGLISYWTSYLKTHYPAQFICSYLTVYSAKATKASKELIPRILEDCRQMGRLVPVLPPDVNRSDAGFRVEQIETANGITEAIRFGLGGIKGVGHLAQAIIAERIAGPYTSFSDFDARLAARLGTRPNKASLMSLLNAGAFDQDIFTHRSKGAWEIQLAREGVKYKRAELEAQGWTAERKSVLDQRQAMLCGNYYFARENMDVLGEEVDNFFEHVKGETVTIGGRVVDAKLDKRSKNGNAYHRITLKTQWGDVIIDFYGGRKRDPHAYLDSIKDKLFSGSVLKVTGQVRDESSLFGGAISLPAAQYRGIYVEDEALLVKEAIAILKEEPIS
jgi:DNA-directed DNA polymerase III PolC